jgi:hypothetical protein
MCAPRSKTRGISGLTGVALAVALVAGPTPGSENPVSAAINACAGLVFVDSDADGERFEDLNLSLSNDQIEPGLPGVVVDLIDHRFTTTTGGDGSWSVDVEDNDYPIRLRFTLPDGYVGSGIGESSGGIVQIVNAPGQCGVGGVGNLGAYVPADFCQAQPAIVTTCFVVGDADNHDDMTAVLSVSNDVVDNGDTNADTPGEWLSSGYESIATVGEIGTAYGQAAAADGTVYASSFVKRHPGRPRHR